MRLCFCKYWEIQYATMVNPACWAHSFMVSVMHCLCSLALQTPFYHMSKFMLPKNICFS